MTGRVLIVDDDAAIRRVLEVNLRVRGYAVDLAETGADAVALARRHPDLIIVDLGLPDVASLEVIAQVRSFSRVPIVVISAQDADRMKAAALDAGADDYLAKPFPIGSLLASVHAAIGDPAGAGRPARP